MCGIVALTMQTFSCLLQKYFCMFKATHPHMFQNEFVTKNIKLHHISNYINDTQYQRKYKSFDAFIPLYFLNRCNVL